MKLTTLRATGHVIYFNTDSVKHCSYCLNIYQPSSKARYTDDRLAGLGQIALNTKQQSSINNQLCNLPFSNNPNWNMILRSSVI